MSVLWGRVPRIASLISGLIKLTKRNLQRNVWTFRSDNCLYSALFILDTGPTHQCFKGLWHFTANQQIAQYDANHQGHSQDLSLWEFKCL